MFVKKKNEKKWANMENNKQCCGDCYDGYLCYMGFEYCL